MLKSVLVSTLFAALALAQDAVDPVLPNAPYDLTALWVDYGLVMENYPIFAASNVSDSVLLDSIRSFTDVIQQYQQAQKDDQISDTKRRNSIVGMLDILATSKSFKKQEFSDDDWQSSQLDDSVVNRDMLGAVVNARNDIFNLIKDDDNHTLAVSQYQHSVKFYRDLVMSAPSEDLKTLIADTEFDWNLYATRYYDLLQNVVAKKPERYTSLVRGYLAAWLHDGDKSDATFNQLKRNVTLIVVSESTTKVFDFGRGVNSASQTMVSFAILVITLMGLAVVIM